jgi:hypothetical protein
MNPQIFFSKFTTWNKEKNLLLKRERNLSFEQIVSHIESGDLLDIVEHPNKEKFAHQKILIIRIEDYIISVPFIDNGVNYKET